MKQNKHITLAKRIRIIPFLCTLIMCAHCIMLLNVIELASAEILVGLVVFYILMKMSSALGFCITHRVGLVYGYAVYFCCNYERLIGFGSMRATMQIIMACAGVCILCAFVVNHIRNKKCR